MSSEQEPRKTESHVEANASLSGPDISLMSNDDGDSDRSSAQSTQKSSGRRRRRGRGNYNRNMGPGSATNATSDNGLPTWPEDDFKAFNMKKAEESGGGPRPPPSFRVSTEDSGLRPDA